MFGGSSPPSPAIPLRLRFRRTWDRPSADESFSRIMTQGATMRITSIEIINNDDLPAEVRAKLRLPPLPPKPWKEPNVDFYEFQRAIERKRAREKRQRQPSE